MIEQMGYHGTSQAAARKIIKDQNFIISTKKNEWIGHGVYLYELKEKAEWWSRQKSNGTVLECYYNVEPDFILDLDIPEKLDEFISFMDFLTEKGQFELPKDTIERRCKALELYRKQVNHKVTVATLKSTYKRNKSEVEKLGLIRVEKQICVHDVNCFDFSKFRVI